jgi:hypothetical protein
MVIRDSNICLVVAIALIDPDVLSWSAANSKWFWAAI